MKRLNALVLILALLPASLGAQTAAPVREAPATKRVSPTLAWAGVATAATGAVLLLTTVDWPADVNGDGSLGTTYTINGDQYCVTSGTTYVDVKDYGCGTGGRLLDTKWRPALYATVAAGAALIAIGTAKVQVKPMVGPKVAGALATVKW